MLFTTYKMFKDIAYHEFSIATSISKVYPMKSYECDRYRCIDGTHVRIQSPSNNEPNYVNRKGYHSVNVQIVCDDKG